MSIIKKLDNLGSMLGISAQKTLRKSNKILGLTFKHVEKYSYQRDFSPQHSTLYHIIWSFLKEIFEDESFLKITFERKVTLKKWAHHWKAYKILNMKLLSKLPVLVWSSKWVEFYLFFIKLIKILKKNNFNLLQINLNFNYWEFYELSHGVFTFSKPLSVQKLSSKISFKKWPNYVIQSAVLRKKVSVIWIFFYVLKSDSLKFFELPENGRRPLLLKRKLLIKLVLFFFTPFHLIKENLLSSSIKNYS
jgi:hypothetical protein